MISFRSHQSELPAPAADNLIFSERSKTELREQVHTFHRNAELRARLQNIYPDWHPTQAHRFVVGVMRDVGARLHPNALKECPFPVAATPEGEDGPLPSAGKTGLLRGLDDLYRGFAAVFSGRDESKDKPIELRSGSYQPRSPEEMALEIRALVLFEGSRKNIARYSRGEPLEETADGEFGSVLCSPSSGRYFGEYLGSLWATQAAVYAFRDNERLLGETFQVMRRNLWDVFAIFSDENSFNHLMSSMQIIARRSETSKTCLLSQEWLKLSEEDVSDSTDFSCGRPEL